MPTKKNLNRNLFSKSIKKIRNNASEKKNSKTQKKSKQIHVKSNGLIKDELKSRSRSRQTMPISIRFRFHRRTIPLRKFRSIMNFVWFLRIAIRNGHTLKTDTLTDRWTVIAVQPVRKKRAHRRIRKTDERVTTMAEKPKKRVLKRCECRRLENQWRFPLKTENEV